MNKSNNNKFITELRVRGLQISEQEARELMNVAIDQHRKECVMPVLKREKIAHYAILALSYADSLNELMYGIEDEKFKRDFKLAFRRLKRYSGEAVDQFKKTMKDDKVLIDAFESYSNDLSEMIYQHLDVINETYKEQ
ncbi:hypothetical protein [Capnocytophaga sputigena]|uniref:hypothetical protein n=1 Tax=Capnocytophaga sputigena TaxID=1019 RepID=UPI002889A8F5|nr:hypothetical protein [Capnocytophaga sputigena]